MESRTSAGSAPVSGGSNGASGTSDSRQSPYAVWRKFLRGALIGTAGSMLLDMDTTRAPQDALTPDRVVVARPGVLGTGLDGEYVMLDPGPGVYYGLNEVGTAVWHFIQQPRTFGDVQRHVCEAYDVEPERCSDDLRTLFADLLGRDLVTLVDAPSDTTAATDAR